MTSILITAARRAAAAIALAVLGIPFPAVAQVWTVNGCSGCHGAPPTIANSSGSGSFTLGFGESWMTTSTSSDTTPLLNRVHAAGTAQGVAAMQNLTAGEADSVFAYFVQVRDGTASGSAPSVGSGKVGVAKSVNFSFTLTNYRNVATTFTVDTSGGAASDYSVQSFSASGAAGCAGTTLPAASSISGVSCTITGTVSFTPSVIGARSTTLTAALTSTFAGQAVNVYGLSGTGVLPNIAISPSSKSFIAKVGGTAQQAFIISNSSSVALDLTSITVSPSPQYTRNGGDCATAGSSNVAAGDSCTVIVQFAPTAAGAAPAGTLSIGHDADNVSSPATASLTGTGTVSAVSLSAGTLAFGNSQLGVAKTLNGAVTLTNTGNADLVFPANPFAFSGSNPGDFSFGGTCGGATVTPGNSCSLNGTFTPGGLGSRSATLTISSDASNGSQNILLSGTGVALPEPVVTFPASDFPDTVIGATASQTRQVTIVNNRTLDIGYTVANTTDFNVQTESCPTKVVPGGGGSCTVTWRFQPQLAGGETLRTANVTFNFTGTGGNPAPTSVVGSLAGNALLPLGAQASLAPSAGFGLPSTSSTLLSNRSTSAITLSTLAFSGAAAADYSLDATNGCTAGLSLASGTSCTLVLRFNPSAGGTRNATLTITHNALGSPQAIALNGSATQAAIQLSSFALTFPSTALNASASQSITVANNGTQALNFSAFDVAGAAAGDYTRSGDCAVGTPLAVAPAQCTVTITFQPTALGTRSASLTIQSDASNGPATVTLTGTGVPIPAPQVTLAPTALDFGTQTVGNPYPARTIRLSNSGNADLHSTSVVVEGGAFATSSTCPGTLVPGAGCDVQIQFAPVVANTDYTGTLRVVSDAAGSPHTALLTGRGSVATLAALTWSPLVAQIDFGTVSAGTLSTAETATLRNDGPGGATLTVLNAIGADATSFAITGGTCAVGATLFEGQTCTVSVQFAPSVAGARTATLQVASTGSFPPTLTLRGTGLGGPTPGMSLSAAALSFATTRVGAQSLPAELTLSSNGSGSLQVTALAVDGPYTVQNRTCASVPFTLPAGSECTVSVSFAPQAAGTIAGALRVTTSASATPTEVALSGQGEPAPDLSSGGCSIATGESLLDPTLWVLVLLAVGVLAHRHHARTMRRGGRSGRGRS